MKRNKLILVIVALAFCTACGAKEDYGTTIIEKNDSAIEIEGTTEIQTVEPIKAVENEVYEGEIEFNMPGHRVSGLSAGGEIVALTVSDDNLRYKIAVTDFENNKFTLLDYEIPENTVVIKTCVNVDNHIFILLTDAEKYQMDGVDCLKMVGDDTRIVELDRTGKEIGSVSVTDYFSNMLYKRFSMCADTEGNCYFAYEERIDRISNSGEVTEIIGDKDLEVEVISVNGNAVSCIYLDSNYEEAVGFASDGRIDKLPIEIPEYSATYYDICTVNNDIYLLNQEGGIWKYTDSEKELSCIMEKEEMPISGHNIYGAAFLDNGSVCLMRRIDDLISELYFTKIDE